jgi:hypothetical protein
MRLTEGSNRTRCLLYECTETTVLPSTPFRYSNNPGQYWGEFDGRRPIRDASDKFLLTYSCESCVGIMKLLRGAALRAGWSISTGVLFTTRIDFN